MAGQTVPFMVWVGSEQAQCSKKCLKAMFSLGRPKPTSPGSARWAVGPDPCLATAGATAQLARMDALTRPSER
eukprot:4055758-Alexandrium_andersonii.AAC.1